MVEPERIARAVVASCDSRKAEIPVPSWLGNYDKIIALTPPSLVTAARRMLDVDRLLTSLDAKARHDYEHRIDAQGPARK